jgi:hypothetical protein
MSAFSLGGVRLGLGLRWWWLQFKSESWEKPNTKLVIWFCSSLFTDNPNLPVLANIGLHITEQVKTV